MQPYGVGAGPATCSTWRGDADLTEHGAERLSDLVWGGQLVEVTYLLDRVHGPSALRCIVAFGGIRVTECQVGRGDGVPARRDGSRTLEVGQWDALLFSLDRGTT